MKVVALAGGVGGARLADGLARCLPAADLTVIVNTGDDFDHYGLRICPDLDTVCYTLSGQGNPVTGWGRVDESWVVQGELKRLGGPGWFSLGDRDLATHLERTRRLQLGQPLSEITRDFCTAWGIAHTVLPMSDDKIATIVETVEMGNLPFQTYFVAEACRPAVRGFHFQGIETAQPAAGVLPALMAADLVVICPSNPWVSIAPVTALPGVLDLLKAKRTLAVSPIIGGRAVKGPAAKMYLELGIEPSASAVAQQYRAFLNGFVLDNVDQNLTTQIAQWGIISLVTSTIMTDPTDRQRLAAEVLAFGQTL